MVKVETINSVRMRLGFPPLESGGGEKMFKNKVTQVLDSSVFQVGSFITVMVLEFDKFEKVLKDWHHINGIIHYCAEDYFTIVTYDGNKKRISLDEIFQEGHHPKIRYRIEGIAHRIERKK